MNLALGTFAATETNVVVRIRGGIIQIRAKRTINSPIIPIAATDHSPPAANHNPTHSY